MLTMSIILVWVGQTLLIKSVGPINLTTGYANYKWWHSVFWWGVQVLMVNLCQCYCKFQKMNGPTPLTHYEYQKSIAHVWLDKEYYFDEDSEKPSSRSG